MTRIVAVIPARMGSSRFPGKPLAKICGLPMIEHVYRRTSMSKALDSVHVATCDQEIADTARGFGASVIMTSASHERASDRVAEVAEYIPADIYVMVQGDEPLIIPEMIDLALQPLLTDGRVVCTNLAARIESEADFEDSNTIKVVMNKYGDALFMSREPIPSRTRLPFAAIPVFKQVCVIPFRHDFLTTYTALEPTDLERAESIDMLRAMEHGYSIRMVPSNFVTQAVDTIEDLRRVEETMRRDPLLLTYWRERVEQQRT